MAHNHDHDHNHDERELITLVDEQGNETLFEILWPLMEKKNLVKTMFFLIPANAEEDENGEVKSKHTHLLKTKTEQKATFNQSQKIQMMNGTWLKKSSTAL